MLYDCKTNNQSQKRCTMDSFKEKDKLALKPSKRPRIEVDEEIRTLPRKTHRKLHPKHRYRLLKKQMSTPKRLL